MRFLRAFAYFSIFFWSFQSYAISNEVFFLPSDLILLVHCIFFLSSQRLFLPIPWSFSEAVRQTIIASLGIRQLSLRKIFVTLRVPSCNSDYLKAFAVLQRISDWLNGREESRNKEQQSTLSTDEHSSSTSKGQKRRSKEGNKFETARRLKLRAIIERNNEKEVIKAVSCIITLWGYCNEVSRGRFVVGYIHFLMFSFFVLYVVSGLQCCAYQSIPFRMASPHSPVHGRG